MARTKYRGTYTVTVEIDGASGMSNSRFSPGLHENEHTEAVFLALGELKTALWTCQNADHEPG